MSGEDPGGREPLARNAIHAVQADCGIEAPRYRSMLVVHAGYHILFETQKPGRWCRWWYRALLGWRWEDL